MDHRNRKEENRIALWGVSVVLMTLAAIVAVWRVLLLPLLAAVPSTTLTILLFLALVGVTFKAGIWVFLYVGEIMKEYRS